MKVQIYWDANKIFSHFLHDYFEDVYGKMTISFYVLMFFSLLAHYLISKWVNFISIISF